VIIKRPDPAQQAGIETIARVRLPAEIDVYLRRLCEVLAELLGARLVAVHALGGLALGDYRPGSSDLDVYVIVGDPLDDEVKRAIARACSDDALACPARELELVVITAAEASRAGAAPRWELNLNTGRDRADHAGTDPAREPAFWFVLDLAIARQSAVGLVGPEARELVGSPPRSVLAAAQADAVAWYARNGTAEEAVVAACRAWHWHQTGTFVAKRAALRWARARLASVDAGGRD
jgi:predicted nucleotidyltransferase